MTGNVEDGGRDDDTSCFLVVQGDGLLVLEGGCCPVVQRHIQLFLCLAWRLDYLLIRQTLILIER